jgi:hypothetical protein
MLLQGEIDASRKDTKEETAQPMDPSSPATTGGRRAQWK